MSTLKPLQLVELFEDLGYRLARHSDAIRSLVQDAESTQTHVTEHQMRLNEQVQLQRQAVADDQELVAQAIEATDSAYATSQATRDDLMALSNEATTTRQAAESKWKAWQREQEAAERELEGARRELAHALHLVAQAEFAIARADSALRQANSQLQSCQARAAEANNNNNNNNRPGSHISCSAEQSAVAQAQQELSGAQSALASAQGQKLIAERAVAHAEARLQRAVEAVAVAENAVFLSQAAEEDMQYSVNNACQATELAETLRRTADNLNTVCEQQAAVLEQLSVVSSQAEQKRLEAAESLRTIFRLLDVIEHLSRSCRNDLALRAEDLRRLEQRFSF